MQNVPLHPLAVANYFVQKSLSDGSELTPMKLVKLTYIAHGWYLGLTKGTALLTEGVQAWKYGPVVPPVYHTFKKYYSGQITSLECDNGLMVIPMLDNKEISDFLDKIWTVYKDYTGVQLSTLTHQTGTPWDKVWNGGNREMNMLIPNDLITEYYIKKSAGEVHHA